MTYNGSLLLEARLSAPVSHIYICIYLSILIVGIPPLGWGFFQTGVRRRKYKLGPTKQKSVPGISSLARVYISSSSPQSERMVPPGGHFLRSNYCSGPESWNAGFTRSRNLCSVFAQGRCSDEGAATAGGRAGGTDGAQRRDSGDAGVETAAARASRRV